MLGGSGEKIVKAKMELEESAEAYTNQVVDISHWINEQLQSQLQGVQRNQQKLDTKLVQVLEGLTREHQNLKAVTTGPTEAAYVINELIEPKSAIASHANETATEKKDSSIWKFILD